MFLVSYFFKEIWVFNFDIYLNKDFFFVYFLIVISKMLYYIGCFRFIFCILVVFIWYDLYYRLLRFF